MKSQYFEIHVSMSCFTQKWLNINFWFDEIDAIS